MYEVVVALTSLKIFSDLVDLSAPTLSKVIGWFVVLPNILSMQSAKVNSKFLRVISHNVCDCETYNAISCRRGITRENEIP